MSSLPSRCVDNMLLLLVRSTKRFYHQTGCALEHNKAAQIRTRSRVESRRRRSSFSLCNQIALRNAEYDMQIVPRRGNVTFPARKTVGRVQ